jgi:hypothetical protein
MRVNNAAADTRLVLSFGDLPALGITYSRANIYRLIHKGQFPRPVKLGPNRVAFRRQDIVNFIEGLEPGMCASPKERAKRRRRR